MKQSFQGLDDYHKKGCGIAIDELEWPAVRAAILSEDSNDITFTKTKRSALVLTLDGSLSHLTRMEGICDDTPSKPGDICFIPENAEARVAWKNHEKIQKSIIFEFDAQIFSCYAPELISPNFGNGQLIPKNFSMCLELEYLLRIVGQEVVSNGARGQLFAQSVFRLIAIQIAQMNWTQPAASATDSHRPDTRVSRAIEFIETHYSRDISLLEIANAAGLSITQLTQVFQKTTGETPYSYVISRRLRQAVQLLHHSDLPIAHIALDVGFADQAHLTRTFQRRFGKTPKLVRCQG